MDKFHYKNNKKYKSSDNFVNLIYFLQQNQKHKKWMWLARIIFF